MQGIRLLAQHHVGQLVQSLIAWRQAVNEDIKKNFSSNNIVNVQGVCKRVSDGSTCSPTCAQYEFGSFSPWHGHCPAAAAASNLRLQFSQAPWTVCQLANSIAAAAVAVGTKQCSVKLLNQLRSCAPQAAMEILFLEAAMQVLGEFVPEFWQDQHFQSFFKSMLQ